jgi:translation initiation factor IF-1
MGEDAFRVEGRVMEALPNGTFLAELANGHRLTAFVDGRDRKIFAGLRAGDAVRLQLTPYDLSAGRILVEAKKFKHESPSIG